MNVHRAIETTSVPLLQQTQGYLRSLLAAKAPEAVLLHAWEEFYRIYDDLIRRFVISQDVPSSDVDDCVQEVWSGVIEGLVEFERRTQRPGLRSWLYTLVRRRAVDLFRDRARRSAADLELAKGTRPGRAVSTADPAALCEQKWEAALLQSVLSELRQQMSDINYRILQMRMVDGRPVREVASELNLAPEQVRYRLYRAMRKLRSYMAAFTGHTGD